MMPDSVDTLIEDGDGHGNHLSLGQRQVTITMHQALVKGHQRPQGSRIQAMGFDNIIDAPRASASFIDFCDDPGRFIFGDGFNPHLFNWF